MIGEHLHQYLRHYLAFQASQEMREMYLSSAIRNFAVGAVGIFVPIYLFTLGFAIREILLFYLAVSVSYLLLLPLSGKLCRRHGYEHTILYSSPFLILYYLSLFAIPHHQAFIAAAAVMLAVQKALYWPGFHANFAAWSRSDEGGREVSNRTAINALAASFAPAIGGLVIAAWGFGALFIAVTVLVLLSNVPLLRTPELRADRPFSYRVALSRLIERGNRRQLLTFIGFGEEFITLVLWPIFIAIMIPSLFSLGAIIALSRLINVIVTLYVGRLTDEDRPRQVLYSGTFYTVMSWLVRPLITGGLGVFLIDAFYRISRNMTMVPLLAIHNEDARNHDVMETTILFLMALTLGKIAAILVTLGLVRLFPDDPWTAIFVTAAVFTGLFALMKKRPPVAA